MVFGHASADSIRPDMKAGTRQRACGNDPTGLPVALRGKAVYDFSNSEGSTSARLEQRCYHLRLRPPSERAPDSWKRHTLDPPKTYATLIKAACITYHHDLLRRLPMLHPEEIRFAPSEDHGVHCPTSLFNSLWVCMTLMI